MNDEATRSIWNAIIKNDIQNIAIGLDNIRLESVGCVLFKKTLEVVALDESDQPCLDSAVHLNDCATEWWERLSQKDLKMILMVQLQGEQ